MHDDLSKDFLRSTSKLFAFCFLIEIPSELETRNIVKSKLIQYSEAASGLDGDDEEIVLNITQGELLHELARMKELILKQKEEGVVYD